MFCKTLSELAICRESVTIHGISETDLTYLWCPFGMHKRASFNGLESSSSKSSDQVNFSLG